MALVFAGDVRDDSAISKAVADSMARFGRIDILEDVANAVLYLASDQARFVTGSQFVIDAGLLSR